MTNIIRWIKTNHQSQLFQSIACTTVFSLIVGFFVACGSGRGPITLPGTKAVNAHVTSHLKPTSGIVPSKGAFVAALFFQASTSLGQSFEGSCEFGNNNAGPNPSALGAHAEYGNTGFVALNIPNFAHSCGTFGVTGQTTPVPLSAIGGGDGATPRGSAIFVSGTINALVASAFTANGKSIFCRDVTNTVAANDQEVVLPYLRLSDNTVLLGSGTTQLSPSCQLPLAAGDDIATISVSWSKQ